MGYQLKKLTAWEVLECMKCAGQLQQELNQEDFDVELVELLCEHGALAYYALYQNGSRVFQSAREALEKMTLTDLADFYEAYEQHWTTEEWEQNESFERQVNGNEIMEP